MLSPRDRRSEHTRRQVLDAALELFSHQGYRATGVKEIAEAAGVSTGNVYHHFPDKEAIFRTLLEEYTQIITTPKFPLVRALNAGTFPDNIEQIARASRESVQQYRRYMALHYVDVDTGKVAATVGADQDVRKINGRWLITKLISSSATLKP